MNLKKYIKEVKDFPKKGISFKDISTILSNPKIYNFVIDQLSKNVNNSDVIVSPDARGFLFGAPVALKLNKPFIMIRKPSKLPGLVIKESYKLEYGKNHLEMHKNAILSNQKVAIIDDILATGGTVNAIINLIKKQGGIISEILFLAELSFLNGKEKINFDNIKSLISY